MKENMQFVNTFRCLETLVVENPSLSPHRDSVISMIRETENRANFNIVNAPVDKAGSTLTQNVNQGVEDMKQRVSKIFQKPSGPNFQGIFKKK